MKQRCHLILCGAFICTLMLCGCHGSHSPADVSRYVDRITGNLTDRDSLVAIRAELYASDDKELKSEILKCVNDSGCVVRAYVYASILTPDEVAAVGLCQHDRCFLNEVVRYYSFAGNTFEMEQYYDALEREFIHLDVHDRALFLTSVCTPDEILNNLEESDQDLFIEICKIYKENDMDTSSFETEAMKIFEISKL